MSNRNNFSLTRVFAVIAAVVVAGAAYNVASAASVKTPPELKQKGVVTFCSDIASPPLEYYDNNNKPIGSDVDIGNEIAKRMGLKAKWVNVPFAGIIPALLARHCDAILSQLFDKPARRKVLDFVDYMDSSEAILVAYGNPEHISGLDSLAGKKVAVENGTTVKSILDKKNEEFKKNGKKPMDIVVFPRDTDALEQLRIHQVDAYGTTLESSAYYIKKAPKTFALAGSPFHRILTGIGIRKDEPALRDAIKQALSDMRQDGTYMKILEKWNLKGDALQK